MTFIYIECFRKNIKYIQQTILNLDTKKIHKCKSKGFCIFVYISTVSMNKFKTKIFVIFHIFESLVH